MANTFKFGNGNWAVKDGQALAYNDENNNFKPLPFDFTRASSATRVNRQGLIETVPSGKPRIDFLDNTSGHLLLEPSRTNLMPYSENFSIGNWAALSGSSVQANVAISPDGTQNASRFNYDGTGNGRVEWGFISGLTSGVTYTFSVYLKSESGEVQNVQIGHSGWGLETVTVSSEWKRYTQTVTSNSTTAYPRVKLDTANSILVWGYQMEVGSYQTSYIKTEGSTVTRSAETGVDCLLPNETIVDNSTATVYLEFEALANDASNRWISFEEVGVATDNLFTFRLAAASNLIQIVSRSAGGGQDVVMSETLTDVTANNKIAFNYDGLNWKLAVNGSITDTATAARLFNDNIEKIKFSRYANTNYFYGKVKDLKVYNTALTDTELQNLTS